MPTAMTAMNRPTPIVNAGYWNSWLVAENPLTAAMSVPSTSQNPMTPTPWRGPGRACAPAAGGGLTQAHDLDRDHRQHARRQVEQEAADRGDQQQQEQTDLGAGVELERDKTEEIEVDDVGRLLAGSDLAEEVEREVGEVGVGIAPMQPRAESTTSMESSSDCCARCHARSIVARLEAPR